MKLLFRAKICAQMNQSFQEISFLEILLLTQN